MSNDGLSYLPCLDNSTDFGSHVNTGSSRRSARSIDPVRMLVSKVLADQLAQFTSNSLPIRRAVRLSRDMVTVVGSLFSTHVVASSVLLMIR